MRFAAIGCALLVLACSDSTTEPIAPPISAAIGANAFVSSDANDGEGSLRAALAEASADSRIKHIKVQGVGTIVISSPLVWSGTQAISIDGGGATIDASGLGAGESGLVADGGGDLALRDITVDGAPSYGILVDVPDDRTGVQRADFDHVTVRNNGLHGVLINDQAHYLEDPNSTSDEGSAASLAVSVSGSLIEDNGNGDVDHDGFRINEGGEGSIDATVKHTISTGNGADGLELDERGPGNAAFSLQHTSLVSNGFLSTVDPDDGIDVDEAGPGDIIAQFNHVDVSNNSEQGVDLNENGEGDLRVTMSQVIGSGNGQEGIEFEEDDDVAGGGDLIVDLRNITTNGNGLLLDGDAGLKLREKGAGDLTATVVQAKSLNNLIGGILIQESAAGTVTASVKSALANNNATYGLSILGTGTALVQQLTAVDNPGGALLNDAGVVVTHIP